MNDIRARIEGAGAALADESDLAPLSGSTDGQLSSRITCGSIDGSLHTFAAGGCEDLIQSVRTWFYDKVCQPQFFRQIDAVIVHLHTDKLVCSHGFCQHQGCQADGAKAGDKNGVVSADTDLLDSLINGSETAGYLCAVFVGKLVRKGNEILLICQNVRSHTAVSLPAVSLTEFAFTGNVITSPAVIADAAA